MLRLAGQQVAATGPAVAQETGAVRQAPLDLGAVRRFRARHGASVRLVDPAECGNVVVRAEQNACLTRARLGRQIRLPFRQRVTLFGNPPRHLGCAAVAHRPPQHGQTKAVDFEEYDPGNVRDRLSTGPARDPLRHTEHVRVVIVQTEERIDDNRDGRYDECRAQRGAERVDGDGAGGNAAGQQEDRCVEREDEEQAEEEREREA